MTRWFLVLVLLLGVIAPRLRSAQGPARLIPVSGVLVDAMGQPRRGVVRVTLAVYAAREDAAPLWTEDQTVALDDGGHFSLELGAPTGGVPVDLFATGAARWLGIKTGHEVEPARVELLAVTYAVAAADATTLAGAPAAEFVRTDDVKEAVHEAIETATGRSDAAPGEAVQATVNQIPKFTSSGGAVDDSVITDAGGFIGIGTTTPNYLLQLHSPAAHALFQLTNATTGVGAADGSWLGLPQSESMFRVNNQEAGPVRFYTNGAQQVTLDSTGQLGVGTGAPNYPMHLDSRTGHALFQLTNTSTGSTAADGSYLGVLAGDNTFRVSNQENAGIELFTEGLRRMTVHPAGVSLGGNRGGALPLELFTPTGNVFLQFTNPTTGTASTDGSYIGLPSFAATLRIVNQESAPIEFYSNGTRRMTITLAGNLEINMGDGNLGIGVNALDSLAVGTAANNTAIGRNALTTNSSGGGNTAVGRDALAGNFGGTSNTAIGYAAAMNLTTGHENVALGPQALWQSSGGRYNTAVGGQAMMALGGAEENTDNVAIGYQAGVSLLSGVANVYVGNAGGVSESRALRIGTSGTHSRTFIAGIFGTTTGVDDAVSVVIDSNGHLGTIPSSRRFKTDIRDMGEASAGLARLRPVTFRYRQPYADASTPLDYGLIAEEVAAVYPDLVVRDAEGRPETVQYHKLVPMLLNQLQQQETAIGTGAHAAQVQAELLEAQRVEIEAQQRLIDTLLVQVDALEAQAGK